MRDDFDVLNQRTKSAPAVSARYAQRSESTAITASDFRNAQLWSELQELVRVSLTDAENGEGVVLSESVIRDAMQLLNLLPPKSESPTLLPLEDGGLSLEWQRAPQKILSVSIYGDGYIIWGARLQKTIIKSVIVPILNDGNRRRSHGVQFLLNTLDENFPAQYALGQ